MKISAAITVAVLHGLLQGGSMNCTVVLAAKMLLLASPFLVTPNSTQMAPPSIAEAKMCIWLWCAGTSAQHRRADGLTASLGLGEYGQ